MLFFYQEISEFNKKFAFLFVQEEDDEQEGEGEPNGNKESNPTYAWLSLIRIVSDLTHIAWDKVWDMGIGEFFQYVSYSMEYNKRQEEMMNRYKHSRSY